MAKDVYTAREAAQALGIRSEEHTSELQSRSDLVCRLLLEKKKKTMRGMLRLMRLMISAISVSFLYPLSVPEIIGYGVCKELVDMRLYVGGVIQEVSNACVN